MQVYFFNIYHKNKLFQLWKQVEHMYTFPFKMANLSFKKNQKGPSKNSLKNTNMYKIYLK